jgi:DNA replication protein DnaC
VKPTGKKWSPSSADIEEAQKRREEYGYAPNPYCEKCHGAGVLHPVGEDGKPEFDKVVACSAPGCLAESYKLYKQEGEYLKTKGVSPRRQSFESFDKKIPGVKETYGAFYDLAHGQTKLPFLLVYGGVGNGKSHLCEATTIVLNRRGIDARLYTVADLMARLKDSISTNTAEQEVKHLKEVPALVLDDLGVEYGSSWEMAKIEEIIDARYRNQLITVLTTNRDLDQLPERVVSRFSDPDVSRCVLNGAKDYRRR